MAAATVAATTTSARPRWPIVRARRFDASRRWSSSRSRRAWSFRSAFVRRRSWSGPSWGVVGQLRSSLMGRGSLPAFRCRRSASRILRHPRGGPILLAPSPRVHDRPLGRGREGACQTPSTTGSSGCRGRGAPGASTGSSRSPSADPPCGPRSSPGSATWLTMAYILFVNPPILGAVPDATGTTLAFLGRCSP